MELALTKLKNGESGTITTIKRSGRGESQNKNWGLARRLTDMGLTPGTQITVVKAAPFNGPLELIVRSSRLALGRGIADRIMVELEQKS